jgi:uncharacterized phage protein (TIGR02218 family)
VKIVSAALQTYLAAMRGSDAPMIMADCFTIILATQATMHFTNIDHDVTFAGATFQANAVLIDGLKYKCATGLEVDKQQITIAAWPTQTLNGAPVLQAIAGGAFDGAHVKRYRVFIDPSLPGGVDGVLLFQGRVSTIDSVGRTQAKITIASDLAILEYDMPHNLFGPTCSHVLYDQGCGANRASFTFAGAVGAGSSQTQINWTGAQAGMTQGAIDVTSGLNTGIQTTIRSVNPGVALALLYPLPYPPAPGDLFTAFFGCDHTIATCQAKFNNVIHFRGFPFVPPVEMTI